GIETITYNNDQAGKENRPINIKCLKCSLGDVLNQLIMIDNRYAWSNEDGAINITPIDPADRIVDTYIQEIQIKHKDMDDVRECLFKVPEVTAAVKKMSLTPLIFMSSGVFGAKSNEEEKIWFSQTNTTLIKVLNEIVKRVGAKRW